MLGGVFPHYFDRALSFVDDCVAPRPRKPFLRSFPFLPLNVAAAARRRWNQHASLGSCIGTSRWATRRWLQNSQGRRRIARVIFTKCKTGLRMLIDDEKSKVLRCMRPGR
jgi:hypothetical protein